MRTRHALSGAIAVIALSAAAGCASCSTPLPPPADAPQATVQTVTVVTGRPNRRRLWFRCGQATCWNCGAALAPAAAEPVKVVVAEAQPAAQPEVKKVLILEPAKKDAAGRTVTVLQRGRRGKIVCYDGRIAVVQPAQTVVAAEPATLVVSEPAIVEPVAVVEEPSWTKYLAPEQPTVVAEAEPALLPAEPYTFAPAPVYIAPQPVAAVQGQQPIVIQPIIQPVIQTGQEVLSGQVQMQMPVIAAPGVPSASVFPTDPLVCGPGQNCFTLSDNQLQTGPQVWTPTAAAPLMTTTGALVAPTAPVAAAVTAPVLAVPPAAAQDKYGALTPAPEVAARPTERPEVSMPAPLGQMTTPQVAGTDEIENALDVMLGNSTPVLK